jgi:hypothetical protein
MPAAVITRGTLKANTGKKKSAGQSLSTAPRERWQPARPRPCHRSLRRSRVPRSVPYQSPRPSHSIGCRDNFSFSIAELPRRPYRQTGSRPKCPRCRFWTNAWPALITRAERPYSLVGVLQRIHSWLSVRCQVAAVCSMQQYRRESGVEGAPVNEMDRLGDPAARSGLGSGAPPVVEHSPSLAERGSGGELPRVFLRPASGPLQAHLRWHDAHCG